MQHGTITRSIVRALGALALGAFCAIGMGAAEPQESDDGSPRLRCWQEGELIFEKIGWKTLSVPTSEAQRIGPSSQSGRALALVQVGRALCLLEQD
jgi:hypothetical protein